MKAEKFRAVLLSGHKEAAVEVPFNPSAKWSAPPRAMWVGRRGHNVQGRMNGVRFESAIVPRSRRFWLLVDDDLRRAAGLSIGDLAEVLIEPRVEPVRTRRRPSSRTRASAGKAKPRNSSR